MDTQLEDLLYFNHRSLVGSLYSGYCDVLGLAIANKSTKEDVDHTLQTIRSEARDEYVNQAHIGMAMNVDGTASFTQVYETLYDDMESHAQAVLHETIDAFPSKNYELGRKALALGLTGIATVVSARLRIPRLGALAIGALGGAGFLYTSPIIEKSVLYHHGMKALGKKAESLCDSSFEEVKTIAGL